MDSREVIRILVDTYYQWQEKRKASANQIRAITKGDDDAFGAEVRILKQVMETSEQTEKGLKKDLGEWADSLPEGRWLRSQVGIGPVLAAGLLAHLDINKAAHRSSFWRFAGLDPTSKWGKGEKRPWNADLKVLCWRLGDSFVKQSNHPDCFYGKVYRDAKIVYSSKNDSGVYADLAARELADRGAKMRENQRSHYEAGKLPPGRIDLMARRKAVKLLLAHLWEIMRECSGLPVEPPYPMVKEPDAGHEWIRPPKAEIIREAVA